jgi:hypothetical protein
VPFYSNPFSSTSMLWVIVCADERRAGFYAAPGRAGSTGPPGRRELPELSFGRGGELAERLHLNLQATARIAEAKHQDARPCRSLAKLARKNGG